MSDRESVEETEPGDGTAEPRLDVERLSRLPLDVLLYYVLHGDEYLARLRP